MNIVKLFNKSCFNATVFLAYSLKIYFSFVVNTFTTYCTLIFPHEKLFIMWNNLFKLGPKFFAYKSL